MIRLLIAMVCITLFGAAQRPAFAADVPNVLIIMADDCTYNDLSIYGGENARTPNIDHLASQGLTFNRAYLCEAMCQPCRAALYTGQFPMRNGCAWNHSASRPTTQSLPQHLGQLSYRVGIAGKVHVKPEAAFPFESVSGFDPNCVRNPTQVHDVEAIRDFMGRDRLQPFCLVVALVEPHVPWVMGDPSQYPPKKIKLPPNLADTPRTREDYSRYLAEITYMDSQVGEILQVLEQTGQADHTLVLFTSEQGSQFPGCKWTNWDTGLHTALIARWPGKVEPGKRTDAIVQYVDVVPTLIDAAGGDPGNHPFDGTSFLPVLTGHSASHREFAFGLHNNVPEGPSYPIRTITNGDFRLIHNLSPEEIYIEKHVMGINGNGGLNNPYWPTWVWSATDNAETYNLVRRYVHRPEFEFYHTAEDQYELENLADDPKTRSIREELGRQLESWLAHQGDPGSPQDTTAALEAARRGKHLYHPGADKQ